ncbi:SH3 and cysteine-rich domain-containing protein 2-like [Siphateles boraxobius]|uniref:SH3 and cysteine-rich domain-containing protein 2-like n=1 Tax=Siphateles boraxobius TaxID=180520 RepID=UPI004063D0FA
MFKRNLSSPVLTDDRLCAVKTQEVKALLDPVYSTLRFETSVAITSRSSFGSFCESPTHSQDEEESQEKNECVSTEGKKLTENPGKVE